VRTQAVAFVQVNAMACAAVTDASVLLVEIAKKPRRYQELKAMLADDPFRSIDAIDHLLDTKAIERCRVGGISHFRARARK
jgi:hypothetical protein